MWPFEFQFKKCVMYGSRTLGKRVGNAQCTIFQTQLRTQQHQPDRNKSN